MVNSGRLLESQSKWVPLPITAPQRRRHSRWNGRQQIQSESLQS